MVWVFLFFFFFFFFYFFFFLKLLGVFQGEIRTACWEFLCRWHWLLEQKFPTPCGKAPSSPICHNLLPLRTESKDKKKMHLRNMQGTSSILQASILQCVAIPSSRGSSRPRGRTGDSWRIPVDRGSLVSYSPRGRKEQDTTERLTLWLFRCILTFPACLLAEGSPTIRRMATLLSNPSWTTPTPYTHTPFVIYFFFRESIENTPSLVLRGGVTWHTPLPLSVLKSTLTCPFWVNADGL